MAPSKVADAESTVNRRRILTGLSAAAASGIAGCNTSDEPTSTSTDIEDGGTQELGERVPEPITILYFSGLGSITAKYEKIVPVLQKNIQQALDIEVEVISQDASTALGKIFGDERITHMFPAAITAAPNRLEYDTQMHKYAIGSVGRSSLMNYASCEATRLIKTQRTAQTREKREGILNEFFSTISHDITDIALCGNVRSSASNNDTVTIKRAGKPGVVQTNPYPQIYSEPKGKDTIVWKGAPQLFQTTNYPTLAGGKLIAPWGQLIHSPLQEYDENYELKKILAKSIETENKGKRIVVELRDATFHNGDSITAEDVKFTFEQLDNNLDVYPLVTKQPYESIETVDEKTVEFNFSRPNLPFLGSAVTKWGIFHKKSWIANGAREHPKDFEFPGIGSGPFELDQFESSQLMNLVPTEQTHPVHNPDHKLQLVTYQDNATAVQAFMNDEFDVLPQISLGNVETIQGEMGDQAKITRSSGFMPYKVQPQMSYPPVSFKAFRHAIGASFDRQLINELINENEVPIETYAMPILDSHPQRPPDDMLFKLTDDPTGSSEQSRQILQDAGWDWDDEGNLRYPKGANTTPPWPKGELPSPEDYPCLTKDNEYKEGWKAE